MLLNSHAGIATTEGQWSKQTFTKHPWFCTNYCYDRFVSHETPNFFPFLFSTKICTWGWGTRLRLVRKTWKTFSLSTTYTLVNCKHSFCKREHQVIIDIFELHYKFSQKYPDISNRQLKTYISMHIFG